MSARLLALRHAGVLSALDVELARTLGRVANEEDELVLLAIALASHKLGEGHVCLPLPSLCRGELRVDAEVEADLLQWPPLPQWLAALRASALCGEAEGNSPLVLDATGRVYLRRYHQYERALVRALRQRVALPDAPLDEAQLEAGLARLFGPETTTHDLQRTAARSAVQRPFLVLSGGPGTGKTSTVVKILALLVEQALHAGLAVPRMHLMAPTGKAAVRVMESIRKAKSELDCTPAVRAAIPEDATTIHRALSGLGSRWRHARDADTQLQTDLVLVDEASMVDLALMAKLFAAIPAHARVILLGDKHQLASVEAGAVLGEICGAGLPASAAGAQPALARSIVHLTRSYRYGDSSGIGALARAINAGDADAALEVLGSPRFPDVELCEEKPDAGLGPRLRQDALRKYAPVFGAQDPVAALTAFDDFRILCAHRKGPTGVLETQRALLRLFFERGLSERADMHFLGAPLLVIQNDHRARLWNGDIGIVTRSDGGAQRSVSFVAAGGAVRSFGLARLPPHESALAMSIHKSQGSEVGEVAVVLPRELSPLLTRELLYTAVTRARHKVVIHTTQSVVRAAVQRVITRSSGLGEALYAPDGLG